jgi:hypothetical protein
MLTPFGPPLDIQKLRVYTETHTPQQIVEASRT